MLASTPPTAPEMLVDVLMQLRKCTELENVALHREYSPGIVFIVSKGGSTSIMSKINTRNNSS
jgi:hypothetical protein